MQQGTEGDPLALRRLRLTGQARAVQVQVGVSASRSPCASEQPRRALRGTHGFAAAARTLRGQRQEQVRKVPEEWEGLAWSEQTCGARGPRRRQRQRHCFFPWASAALQNASQPEPSPRTCPARTGTHSRFRPTVYVQLTAGAAGVSTDSAPCCRLFSETRSPSGHFPNLARTQGGGVRWCSFLTAGLHTTKVF